MGVHPPMVKHICHVLMVRTASLHVSFAIADMIAWTDLMRPIANLLTYSNCVQQTINAWKNGGFVMAKHLTLNVHMVVMNSSVDLVLIIKYHASTTTRNVSVARRFVMTI